MKKILIVGGSGYLGQFLLDELSRVNEVAYTYYSRQLNREQPGFPVNLSTGEGLIEISNHFGNPDVVINCAAVSQPKLCEEEPESSRTINVPEKLITWLCDSLPTRPLLLHISTDHVYEGSKSLWVEEDDCVPVNQYGKFKLEAESLIRAKYKDHFILRSSIIYGPKPKQNIGRGLFLQWMDEKLQKREDVSFFSDEYRSPIYVYDIVQIVHFLIDHKNTLLSLPLKTFNMGGPERLSRYDMAKILAEYRRYDANNIQFCERPKDMKAPLDASMNVSYLGATLNLNMTKFEVAIKEIF